VAIRIRHDGLGPAGVRTRPRVPLIAGEAMQPLDRALVIADSANKVSRELPMDGLDVRPTFALACDRTLSARRMDAAGSANDVEP
jgi:hypothetical protein